MVFQSQRTTGPLSELVRVQPYTDFLLIIKWNRSSVTSHIESLKKVIIDEDIKVKASKCLMIDSNKFDFRIACLTKTQKGKIYLWRKISEQKKRRRGGRKGKEREEKKNAMWWHTNRFSSKIHNGSSKVTEQSDLQRNDTCGNIQEDDQLSWIS